MNKITFVDASNDYRLYVYTPSLFHPVHINFERMPIKLRLRYLRNYLRTGKYVIYYLKFKDELVGMCAVTPGGSGLKIRCTDKEDIILGPYFIVREKRGNGYSKALIKMVLKNYPSNYKYAYDIIAKENRASLRASEACGFKVCEEINFVGILRNHQSVRMGMGTHYILRYTRL